MDVPLIHAYANNMKSFYQYLNDNYAVPLFATQVEEDKVELLLDASTTMDRHMQFAQNKVWLVRDGYMGLWSRPLSAEQIMDMLKFNKINTKWNIKNVGENDMEQRPILLDKQLIGIFHSIRDARNKYLYQDS